MWDLNPPEIPACKAGDHPKQSHSPIKLVEGVGVEPTYSVLQTDASTVTANLPLKIFFFMSRRNIRNYLHIVNRFIRYLLKYLNNFLTLCKNIGGQGWTRTTEDRSQSIYSAQQLPLCDLPIKKSLYKELFQCI